MTATRSRRATALAALASIALVATLAVPAAAAEPAFEMDLPAGWACQDFDLRITGYGEGPQAVREFTGEGGSMLYLEAGTGFEMRYTNLATGVSMGTRANGAVNWRTFYPDGSWRQVSTGHNIVILFPSDVPAGPSTTLHVGRVVIDVAADGVWTVQNHTGTTLDICAALSS